MQDTEIAQGAAKLTPEEERLYRIRHSLAHVMAQAVLSLHPDTKLGFGPPVDNGFYYDFDFSEPITAEELPEIEKRMRRIIQEKQPFARTDMAPAEAQARIATMGQPFKEEAAHDLAAGGVTTISFYENGPFVDMCEGPHLNHTGEIPVEAFKLDSIAGAYWRGSEKNKMLTRIYGLAFAAKEELKQYLERRRLAQERDHRKLGRELDLFHIDDEVGKGLILWLPKGTVLRDEVETLAKETEFRYGYQRVSSPVLARQELYYRSEHLPYFKDSMFPPLELEEEDEAGGRRKEVYYLRPMNCPHHHKIYAARPRSYRELPLRLAEYGLCHRYEKSGELSGLLRVRGFTMNDAHIYCTAEQLQEEVFSLLRMYQELYAVFEYDRWDIRLSLHDPARKDKYHSDERLWQESESALRAALDAKGLKYWIGEDEAAFYGPKIDIQFYNLLGRGETVSTIQIDYLAAKKFELRYVDEHGEEKPPIVIHRAPLSAHERIVAYLIEHYGGAFPTWMAPVQVRLVTISDDLLPYADKLAEELRKDQIRVEVDRSSHSFNKKIRNGTIEKLPILLVIGRKEAEEGTVTIRRYQIKQQETVSFDEFHTELLEEIADRKHVKPE